MGDVLQIISCGCSPTRHVGHLVGLAQRAGWTPYVTLTPSAAKWAPVAELEHLTGYPVRSEHRAADESKPVPGCDAIVVCPATVNTVNKWAAGICDTLALGALVEAVGQGLPVVAVPYGNPALRAHPAFGAAVRNLRAWGTDVMSLPDDAMHGPRWVPGNGGTDLWQAVLSRLPPPR